MKGPGYRDAAVSPVVGVMLMLAVTVMIAGIVSAFAGGMSETPEKTPQSNIKVRVNLNENITYFDHAGGDPFSLNNIQVVLQSGENKTSVKKSDIGKTCINFTQVGSNETTVKAGDTFSIEASTPGNARHENSGLRFGRTIFLKNQEVLWMIIDTRTSKTIAMGSLYL
nr:type IV pilin N-terminal domain-containing protein [uncultured Methanoregula sp.]